MVSARFISRLLLVVSTTTTLSTSQAFVWSSQQLKVAASVLHQSRHRARASDIAHELEQVYDSEGVDAHMQKLVQDLQDKHDEYERDISNKWSFRNNDNVKATHKGGFWDQADGQETLKELHQLQDSVAYWKARYEQACNRLVHDRQHHRRLVHDLNLKIRNLEGKQKNAKAADHDQLMERLAIRDIEICGHKVAVHHAEKRIAEIVRQKDAQIETLQGQVDKTKKKKRNVPHLHWLWGGPLKRARKGLRSFLDWIKVPTSDKKKDEDFYEHYETHEDIYMEY